MSTIYVILSILFIIGCTALITVILMQKKRSAGFGGGSISGMGTSETYWDKNKGRSLEGSLEKYTKIGGALLFVFSIVMCIVR